MQLFVIVEEVIVKMLKVREINYMLYKKFIKIKYDKKLDKIINFIRL